MGPLSKESEPTGVVRAMRSIFSAVFDPLVARPVCSSSEGAVTGGRILSPD